MDVSDLCAVALDHPGARSRGIGKRLGRPDRDDFNADRFQRSVGAASYLEPDGRTDLADERSNRRVRCTVDGQNLIAVLQTCTVRRGAFQNAVNEMTPLDAPRERSDSRIVRTRSPESPGHESGHLRTKTNDVQQYVVFVVIRREKAGVRGLQLGQELVDLASSILSRRGGDHRRAKRLGARSPVELLEYPFIVESLVDGLDHCIVELRYIDVLLPSPARLDRKSLCALCIVHAWCR